MTRIVLAYSGGPETSTAIPWLAETYEADIITVTIDLGQGRDLEEVRDRALANGALRAHVLDARYEFARDCIVRALKAGVLCQESVPIASALGRPLVAQTLVTIAGIEQAGAVAHGDREAVGSAIEAAVRALDPAIKILAPARDWNMTAEQQAEYAETHHVALPVVPANGLPAAAPRSHAAPGEAAFVNIAFERGAPIAINGVSMHPLDLIGSLDIIAGARGVGRVEKVEPSALAALHGAHQALQQATTTAAAAKTSVRLGEEYLGIVMSGSWFTPRRQSLDAEIDALQKKVTGVVRLKLFGGETTIVECTPSKKAAPSLIPLVSAPSPSQARD
jgi:argininosuccinate synthase